MRILNLRVEQIGRSMDGRNLLVARGRDVVRGWAFAVLVPATEGDRVVTQVRAGAWPEIKVPEHLALPWSGVLPVDWE
jgi:hypothetical protein